MTKECFKEMPCAMKLAYILIIISLILNIYLCIKFCNKPKSGKETQDVATWVKNNPEAILESVNRFVMKQQEEAQRNQMAKASENIGKYEKELRDEKLAIVINPKGTKVVVEFFDYNCGYCKMSAKTIEEIAGSDKNVKFVLRSIPILGEPSVYASQVEAAILLTDASKAPAYFRALMAGSARTKDQVNKAAQDAGMKLETLNKVLESKKSEIAGLIEENMRLASKIGVSGTPAFIIGDQLIPGAVDAGTIRGMLK